jgi:flagellar hook-length control protein FliK
MAPADAPRTPVVAQVAAALALSARDGAAEVTMTLRPPELGEVRARIVAGPDGLVIRLSAEREAVGALLRARAGELHQALLVQQVPVAEVHVLHNPPPTPSATAPDWQGWQEQLWLRREPGQQERRPGQEGAYQEADDET